MDFPIVRLHQEYPVGYPEYDWMLLDSEIVPHFRQLFTGYN
jgi:hypothetical protein